ncbi:MAG: 50S ribosomal protein L23 [Candidatus Delongbacteria bacterium]
MAEKRVLIHPILSEKSVALKDERNQYYFRVTLDSNKIEIRTAVEKRYGVSVSSVRTINVGGKVKRMGAHAGRRADWKKAVVTLKPGDKIELVEGL